MNNNQGPPPGPLRLMGTAINRVTKDYIKNRIGINDMSQEEKEDAQYQIEHALGGLLSNNKRHIYTQKLTQVTNSLNAVAANQIGGGRRRKSSRKNKRKTSSRSRSSITAKKSKKSKRSRKTSRKSRRK